MCLAHCFLLTALRLGQVSVLEVEKNQPLMMDYCSACWSGAWVERLHNVILWVYLPERRVESKVKWSNEGGEV